MGASGNLALLQRVDQIQARLKLIFDEADVGLHPELLHRPGGLELVDEDHLRAALGEAVDRRLFQVRLEGALDVPPDLHPIGPTLLLSIDEHRLRVLRDEVRSRESHRALSDGLDLQQRILLPPLHHEFAVGLPADAILRDVERNLAVLEEPAGRAAVRAHLRSGGEPHRGLPRV